MHVRITHMRVDATRVEEIAEGLETVMPRVSELAGLEYWFSALDRDTGEGESIAVYDSKENSDAALAVASKILGGFDEFFVETPVVKEFDVLAQVGKS